MPAMAVCVHGCLLASPRTSHGVRSGHHGAGCAALFAAQPAGRGTRLPPLSPAARGTAQSGSARSRAGTTQPWLGSVLSPPPLTSILPLIFKPSLQQVTPTRARGSPTEHPRHQPPRCPGARGLPWSILPPSPMPSQKSRHPPPRSDAAWLLQTALPARPYPSLGGRLDTERREDGLEIHVRIMQPTPRARSL